MKILLDQDRCVASGQCVMTDPDVFDQRDEDGVAILLTPSPNPAHHTAVREAAAICPAAAIQLAEDQ
ncbi:ferredoxin [Actinoplanes couchii]|uniref:Ferredoxin n=1 Tax=Actinoplanes couchii TaxID=403638 RepID=A0ABQ3XNP2_9ACTN|nr:ferredoxin [Actinoplanes couchii]MDR6319641.1 ferredoxin [Actinoplanes couchii]GID60137.1 ferredoxin [Actinoplanes couchii]